MVFHEVDFVHYQEHWDANVLVLVHHWPTIIMQLLLHNIIDTLLPLSSVVDGRFVHRVGYHNGATCSTAERFIHVCEGAVLSQRIPYLQSNLLAINFQYFLREVAQNCNFLIRFKLIVHKAIDELRFAGVTVSDYEYFYHVYILNVRYFWCVGAQNIGSMID